MTVKNIELKTTAAHRMRRMEIGNTHGAKVLRARCGSLICAKYDDDAKVDVDDVVFGKPFD